MAKLRCVCGEVITTSGLIPNPDQWQFIADERFDEFTGLVDAEVLYRAMSSFFRCPVSGHLWVFWDGFDAPPTVYEPLDVDFDAGD